MAHSKNQMAWSNSSCTAGIIWFLDLLGIIVSLAMYWRFRAKHMVVLAIVSALHLVSFSSRFVSLAIDRANNTLPGELRHPSATASDMTGNTAAWLFYVLFTSMNAHRLYYICYVAFPRLVRALLALAFISCVLRSANFVIFCVEIATGLPINVSGLATTFMTLTNIFEMIVNAAIGITFIVYLQTLYVNDSAATKHDHHVLADIGMSVLLRRLQYLLAVEIVALTISSSVTEAFPDLDPLWSTIWISLSFRTLTYCYFLSSLAMIMQSLAEFKHTSARASLGGHNYCHALDPKCKLPA